MKQEPAIYAGIGARATAFLVDWILVIVLLVAVIAMEQIAGARLPWGSSLVLIALYFAAFPLTRWQATPGKHVAGLRIADRAGARIGAGRSVLRFAASIVSIATCGLGYVLAAWNGRHQALHDFLAGTVVVRSAATPEQIAASIPQTPPWSARIGQSVLLVLALGLPAWIYLYPMHGLLAMELNDHNMAEALAVIAALDAHHKKNARYPENLSALSSEHLPRQPHLAQRSALHYSATPSGDQCWLAIVYWYEAAFAMPSDRVNEYECRTRKWSNLDYSEMHAKSVERP